MPHPTCPLGVPRISVGNAGDTVLIVVEMNSTEPLNRDQLDTLLGTVAEAISSLRTVRGL